MFGQCPGLTRLNILNTISSQNRQQRKQCEPKQRTMAQGELNKGILSIKGRPLVQTLSRISEAGTTRSRMSSRIPWGRTPLSQKSRLLYLERISHGHQHLTCGLSCCVGPNGGIGARYRSRGSRQNPRIEPLPHRAQLVPCMWIGYTEFEGGQKSSKSSQSEVKQRSFQSCFGKGTKKGGYSSGGSWREENVETGTTWIMQRPS